MIRLVANRQKPFSLTQNITHMKQLIGLLMACLVLCFPAVAQKRTQEVLYLKNGTIIRGIQSLTRTDSLLEIYTTEGSLLRIPASELEKIDRESITPKFTKKGFFWGADWGFGLGKPYQLRNAEPDDATQRVVALQVSGGYRWNPHWSTSLGIGVDSYKDFAFWPVSLRGTYVLLNRRVSPIVTMDAGYSFRSGKLESPTPDIQTHIDGGLLFNPSAGILVHTGCRTSFILSAGYRQQTYTQTFTNPIDETRTEQAIVLRRFFMRIGWIF